MKSQTRRSKVGSACQRCRRQKLKCDIKRPCTLCLRAGIECQTADQWRVVQQTPVGNESRKGKRRRETLRDDPSQRPSSGESHYDAGPVEQPWSSSTMSLAFQFHNCSTPDTSMTTALPGGQRLRQSEASTASSARQPGGPRQPATNPWQQSTRSLAAELVSLLPSRDVAALLVDTYFDRIHWFMLIFHQDDFRQSWQQMYDLPREQLADACPNPGFISTFLVVTAIALQYTGAHRRRLLEAHSVDLMALKERLFSTIRAKMLDIVSLGSLEAVQTCVLLGTYYLYHGNPGLAWPVCGCGLRIAQALNLHRKVPSTGPTPSATLRQYETRKRCWWAIYEIETFCSMSYGYPHGIKDADCDVDLLDPLAKSAAGQSPASVDAAHQCPASLLSYKYLMSKLSVLIKDILTDLYGLGSFTRNNQNGRPGSSSILPNLVRKVSTLDARLQEWNSEIPNQLRLNNPRTSSPTYSSVEEMDRDIGASGPGFENHIYQLQALALELAYENAKILVHRPLLTYKTIPRANPELGNHSSSNPLLASLQKCRDAALKTSDLEATSIFSLAVDTYAAAFIGIHTFTAGVTLCILTSIEPLAPHSYQSKLGLRRLLSMQIHVKSRSHSTLAAQGVEILERLTRLAMEKELKEMLTSSSSKTPLPVKGTATEDEQGIQDLGEAQPDNRAPTMADIAMADGITFDFIEDPAMSQALYDFDQVLSGQDLNVPLEPLLPESLVPGSGFAQEQAWIWGVDSLAQFSGDGL